MPEAAIGPVGQVVLTTADFLRKPFERGVR